jgi:hypothetical protein
MHKKISLAGEFAVIYIAYCSRKSPSFVSSLNTELRQDGAEKSAGWAVSFQQTAKKFAIVVLPVARAVNKPVLFVEATNSRGQYCAEHTAAGLDQEQAGPSTIHLPLCF